MKREERPAVPVFAGPGRIDLEGAPRNLPAPLFNRVQGRRFAVEAQGEAAEIDLYDVIGPWGITADDFRARLKGVTAPTIRLRLNSPGGEVFDGIAIYNDLLEHPARVEVRVTGLAASAASVIAMAGDRLELAENAFLMIHNAWTCMCGDRHDFDQVGAVLQQVDAALAQTYAARSGASVEDMAAAMDAETWYTAEAAVDAGLADAAAEAVEAQARFDLSAFKNTPRALRAVVPERLAPQSERDVERRLMQDAGYSRSQARALMSAMKQAQPGTRDAVQPEFIAALRRLQATISTRGE